MHARAYNLSQIFPTREMHLYEAANSCKFRPDVK